MQFSISENEVSSKDPRFVSARIFPSFPHWGLIKQKRDPRNFRAQITAIISRSDKKGLGEVSCKPCINCRDQLYKTKPFSLVLKTTHPFPQTTFNSPCYFPNSFAHFIVFHFPNSLPKVLYKSFISLPSDSKNRELLRS